MRPYGWQYYEGGDPAPGNPGGIRVVAKNFESIASAAMTAQQALSSLRDGSLTEAWEGSAARKFSEQIESTFLNDLRKLRSSFGAADDAITVYAGRLEDFQADADASLRELESAETDLQSAEQRRAAAANRRDNASSRWSLASGNLRRLDAEYQLSLSTRDALDTTYDTRYNNWFNRTVSAQTERSSAKSAHQDAEQDVAAADDDASRARGALRQARDNIKSIRTRREQAEKDAANELEDASELGIKNRTWFQKAWDSTTAAFRWITTLENLEKVLKTVSTVLMIAALVCGPFFGPLAAALFLAARVASVAAVVIGIAMAMQGRKSWTSVGIDVAFAALDIIALGKAAKLAKAAKLPKSGLSSLWSEAKLHRQWGDLFTPTKGVNGLINASGDVRDSVTRWNQVVPGSKGWIDVGKKFFRATHDDLAKNVMDRRWIYEQTPDAIRQVYDTVVDWNAPSGQDLNNPDRADGPMMETAPRRDLVPRPGPIPPVRVTIDVSVTVGVGR